jgi:branched-chain amino acid transport system substrate-binding protein
MLLRLVEGDSLMHRTNRVSRYLAVAVLVLGLFGLTACEAEKKKEIKIGYSLALTGKYAKTGKYQQEAFQMWAEDVNKRGGLLGQPVKLIHYDDKSDPKTGVKLYEKLITHDKVDLVLGPYSSAVTNPVAGVTEKYKYPMITAGASSSKIFAQGRKYVFGIYSPAKDYFDGALDLAKEKGLKTLALIYADSVFPIGTAKGVKEKAADYGLRIVYEEKYPRKTSDVSAQLSKIKALNPDMVLSAGYLPDAVLITRQMKELDVNPKITAFTVGAAQPEFGRDLGDLAEYAYGASQWEPDPRLPFPQQNEWIARYKKRWGRVPDYHAASGWSATQVMESCIKKIGSINREKLRNCLATTNMMTIHGQYTVDPVTGEQRGHQILLIQWQKGNKEIVFPTKFKSASPNYPTPSWGSR